MSAPTMADAFRSLARMVPCTRPPYPGLALCTTHEDCRDRYRERAERIAAEVTARGVPVRPKSRARRCRCCA